jgi:flagella basal body P-ring formation protein FlgA
MNTLDPKLKLAPCNAVEAFFPGSGRAWGRTSVGLRCSAPYPWTVYIQGNVSVTGEYLVAATPLNQGQTISKSNVMYQRGDLTTLPPGIFTNPSQIIGKVVRTSLSVGAVLKQEMAAMPVVVNQGQTVRIVSIGEGFTITAEGKAQNSATAGQMVQAKVASGQIVSGTANANGQVVVSAQ